MKTKFEHWLDWMQAFVGITMVVVVYLTAVLVTAREVGGLVALGVAAAIPMLFSYFAAGSTMKEDEDE